MLPVTIQSFYKADWDKTRSTLRDLKEIDSKDPMPYFMEAMIPFWAYFFGGMESNNAQSFLELSDVAIKITENRLEVAPEDTSSILLLSGLHGYRSLVAAQEKRYGIAMSSGATGYGYTKSLMKMDNDNPNTLMGQGVFHYMVGSIPSEVRWMARLAGLSGDKQHGFMLLERAAESQSHVSNDARMFLAYLYNRDQEFVKAQRHMSALVEAYPTNPIFHYNMGLIQESLGKNQSAQISYSKVVSIDSAELPELIKLSKERLSILKK
jgi:tetratricopeptide (TPR) repeat protein